MTDHPFAVKATAGATVIYHALNPAYRKWVAQFPALQAGAVAAAEANNAKVVFMDNLYMYEDICMGISTANR